MTAIQDKINLIGTMNVKDLESQALSASRAAFDADKKVNDWRLMLAQDKMATEVRRATLAGLVSTDTEPKNAEARKANLDETLAIDKEYQAALSKIAETENEIASFEATASSWRREYSSAMYAIRARTAMLTLLGAPDAMLDESEAANGTS